MARTTVALAALCLTLGCGASHDRADASTDAGARDSGTRDSGGDTHDGGRPDAGRDAGELEPPDAGSPPTPSGRTWTLEHPLPSVPKMAYQQTRLEVGSDGTPWIAHQRCATSPCGSDESVRLQATHRSDGAWATEDVTSYGNGGFDLTLSDGITPTIAHAFHSVRVFDRVAGAWEETTVDPETPSGQGLALHSVGGAVHLFMGQRGGVGWASRPAGADWSAPSLVREAVIIAAGGRQSIATLDDGLLVVHRLPRPETFVTSLFDPAAGTFETGPDIETGWDSPRPNVVRWDDALCVVGKHDHHLAMVCGSGDDGFYAAPIPREQVFGQPVAQVLADGTLAVAYMHWSDERTRLLTLAPGASRWHIETLYEGPGFGIATAVEPDGTLAASFVACGEWPSEDCSLVYARRQ